MSRISSAEVERLLPQIERAGVGVGERAHVLDEPRRGAASRRAARRGARRRADRHRRADPRCGPAEWTAACAARGRRRPSAAGAGGSVRRRTLGPRRIGSARSRRAARPARYGDDGDGHRLVRRAQRPATPASSRRWRQDDQSSEVAAHAPHELRRQPGCRADLRASGYEAEARSLVDRTCTRCRRRCRCSRRAAPRSSLRRMFLMCESMARSNDSAADPRTASSSCARVKTRPACRASVTRSWNSVGVKSIGCPSRVTRMRVRVDGRDRRRGRRRPSASRCGPPQHGAHARHELARAERLGDVVVGADLQAVQTIVFLDARGEHDDRQVGFAADRRATSMPSSCGKPEVEDDQVGTTPAHQLRARGRRRRPRSPRIRPAAGNRSRSPRSAARHRRRGSWSPAPFRGRAAA